MIAFGQEFKPEMISRIEALLEAEPGISRRALSRRVCEWLDWRSPNGNLKDMSCRKALLKLQTMGAIELPVVANQSFLSRGQTTPAEIPRGIEDLCCSLEDLGLIEIIPIQFGDREASNLWNTLMERFHYLGRGPLCGAQIRYLIRSSIYGEIGGLAFSAAAWRVSARDQWIGWSEEARKKNLCKVVCNSRFLLVPKTPNLASYVLARCTKRLAIDWHERYGIIPTLVETYVLSSTYKGTCYRAANWQSIGITKGRGRMDRTNSELGPTKDIYVYALQSNAREILCATDSMISAAAPIHQRPNSGPNDWAEDEFGQADFGDLRLTRRLVSIAKDMYARPQAHIPQACQTRARAKAAYRFFAHPDTTMDSILNPHYKSTLRRAELEPLVFAVQDSTDLNYSAHPATKNLGPIGSTPTFPIGLMVHDTLLFNKAGTPLGLLDVQCWARDPGDFGKKKRRFWLPIEEKESYKWLKSFEKVAQAQKQCPGTTFVSISDRESDIYELFECALSDHSGPKLLVRSQHNRRLVQDNAHIWDVVTKQPVAGEMIVRTPRTEKNPPRDAVLEIRFAQVTLKPPDRKSHKAELTVWAVRATETQATPDSDPIDWKLITTYETNSQDQAIERVEWYSGRWGIEVYHKTLKSGCRIEERQLGAAERLESCLAVDMVVAWRIYHLAKLGREVPDVLCSVFFEEHEWKALVAYSTKNPKPPDQPPTLREAIRMTAQLGGFLGRQSDKQPGTKSLWLGLQRLDDLAAMYFVMTTTPGPSP